MDTIIKTSNDYNIGLISDKINDLHNYILLNIKFAPSPSENEPIDDLQRPKLKIYTTLIMSFWFIVILFIGVSAYRNIILTAIILETIFILPITYKLANEKRG